MALGNSIEHLLFGPHVEHSVQAVRVPFGFSSAYLMGTGSCIRCEWSRWHFWSLCREMRSSRAVYSMAVPAALHGQSGARAKKISGMAFRRPRPGRDIRIASREDPLRLFLGSYRLTACCRRPGCAHRRDLHTELLVRAFGADTTLGSIGARLRCHRCGMRDARIEARHIGPVGDGL